MIQIIPTPDGFYVAPELRVHADSSDWVCQLCSARVPTGKWGNYAGLLHRDEVYVDVHRAWHASLVTKNES